MTGGIAEKSVQSFTKNAASFKDQRAIEHRKRLRECLTIKPFVRAIQEELNMQVGKVLDWNNGRFLVALSFF